MENDKLQEITKKKNLKLAPETMRIRDAIIEKYSDTPLDALSTKLQALITDDTDTGTKLGIFSARVEILRMRFSEIADKKYVKDNNLGEENDSDIESDISDETEDFKEGWMTLKILEASEVNGVRFPEGVKIDVHADDAKKLLESKKAELISMKIEDAINDNSEETNNVQYDKKGLEEESPSLNPEEMQALASNEEATDENSSKEEVSGLETEQVQDDKKGLEEESPSLNPEEMQALASNEEDSEASPRKEDENDTDVKGIKN